MKPPFAYYGGKTTLASQIADLLPAHEHYIEPFAGSLAVLLAKRGIKWETVNDIDGDLMTFWRVLRDRPEELARACMLTPHSRQEYVAARTELPEEEVERARRVWVRLTQGRNHTVGRGKSGGWKFAKGPSTHDRQSPGSRMVSFASRMYDVAERLREVSLESRDALDVIRDYGDRTDACLYVDPPYLGSTRATNYRHELLGDEQHRAIADALIACKASVVLSGYDSPLYADLFEGWSVTRIKAPPALSGDTGRVEVLWSNRPLAEPDLFGGAA